MKHDPLIHFAEAATPLDGGMVADVAAWRLLRLVEAGFPVPLALELASVPGTDLHALLNLLDRGCPPYLAARILSPTDSTEDWS